MKRRDTELFRGQGREAEWKPTTMFVDTVPL